MKINAVIHGTYDPSLPNPDGTYTFYTTNGGYLWYVRKPDIVHIGQTEQKLTKENERLQAQVLNLQDAASANEEKLHEIELAFDILRRYL